MSAANDAPMKPLIFGTRSVLAWQAHAKTQTRRLVRGRPEGEEWRPQEADGVWWWHRKLMPGLWDWKEMKRQPYAVGDLLWIREGLMKYIHTKYKTSYVIYQADSTLAPPEGLMRGWEWKRDKLPAIFMPHWACRYHARVTSVRPERLQDITDEDAVAEGTLIGHRYPHLMARRNHRLYLRWWESLHKKPGTRSEDNPWVWVYGLEAIDGSSE